MTKDITKKVKSQSDLYYDFFCLLHLPISCSVKASAGEEFEVLSCPVTTDPETNSNSDKSIDSLDKNIKE